MFVIKIAQSPLLLNIPQNHYKFTDTFLWTLTLLGIPVDTVSNILLTISNGNVMLVGIRMGKPRSTFDLHVFAK